jgi:hypothetical protein
MSGSFDLEGLAPVLGRLADRYLDVELPPVTRVCQRSPGVRIEDPEKAAEAAAARVARDSGRIPGPVAVGVGSRGVANIEPIVRGTVRALRAAGWEPFIVPAMGSHGAGSAEGQAAVLAGMGVSEANVGAPVRATMETRQAGELDGQAYPVDRYAVEAGAVLVVSRVKPHTSFRGSVESGAAKMCAVGLGKQAGAQLIHNEGSAGLARRVAAAPRVLEAAGLLVGAVAVVENERDETALVEGLTASEVGAEAEARLLDQARRMMPRLPFERIDVLLVDRMGKDISGSGMDTNVLNRYRIGGRHESGSPVITAITVMDLTERSHGNATGIGLADFVPIRMLSKVDLEALYTNCITAGQIALERAKVPMVLATDRDATRAAVAMCGARPDQVRLAWISDTLHTELIAVSPALLADAGGLDVIGKAEPLPFGPDGTLRPLLEWNAQSR